jgi:peroxiredoxin
VASLKSQFSRRGISVIVISFAEPAMLVRYQEHHQWPFAILADPDRRAYEDFALPRLLWRQVFSLATLKLYFTLLRQGKRRQPYGGEDIRQAGGDFLIDRAGSILFAHRSREPADRPTPGRLIQEFDSIREALDK